MPSCWPPAVWPSLPCSTSCSDARPTAACADVRRSLTGGRLLLRPDEGDAGPGRDCREGGPADRCDPAGTDRACPSPQHAPLPHGPAQGRASRTVSRHACRARTDGRPRGMPAQGLRSISSSERSSPRHARRRIPAACARAHWKKCSGARMRAWGKGKPARAGSAQRAARRAVPVATEEATGIDSNATGFLPPRNKTSCVPDLKDDRPPWGRGGRPEREDVLMG